MGRAAQPVQGLDSEELLRAWEGAAAAEPAVRGAALLAAVLPDLPVHPAQLPLGTCDTLLLALRVGTFGSDLSALAECPSCQEQVEVEVDAAAMLASLPAVEVGAPADEQLRYGDCELRFRLPTADDLAVAATASDQDTARELVVRRCVLEVVADGAALEVTDLPPGALTAVSSRMADADPAADLRLRVVCPACAQDWSAPLDVAAFFHAEIAGAATALLVEVDELAANYGWSERDILDMTPTRRRTYLDLR